MRLLAMSVDNFRSYNQRVVVPIGSFTAIIGRNDVGKSTLLEALEIFFNNQLTKIDQSDPCVHNAGKVVEIGCIFDELPESLTIDAKSITTLATEHLLNAGGQLELVKRFDCRPKTPKEEIFARANYPVAAQLSDLLQLKNDGLKARAREVGVSFDSSVDLRSNSSLRDAIRRVVGDADRAERLIPLAEEDGKKIWDQLQKQLPAFALFQADRPSKDDDPEIADPMKAAVSAAVREVEADLEQIKQRVQRSAMEVAQRTLAKLREMDPHLARELTPSFKAEPKWDGFKLSLTGDDQIPINKRGSGVRRLILLNFFRAEAERRREANLTRQVIYAIEEPESSQHPDNQVMLVKALLALSEDPQTQVLMTTHVPAIAGLVPTESVRFVSRDATGHPVIQSGTEQVLDAVTASLGLYPDKRARLAIFVEGPHDICFLSQVSRIYSAHNPNLIDISNNQNIAFIPTGGGNLKHWVEKRYLQSAGMIEVHIYDRDSEKNPKYAKQVADVNGRGTRDIAFLTKRREMENYIHPACIQEEYRPDYDVIVEVTDWCDVPAQVAAIVYNASAGPKPWEELETEKREAKISRAKQRLNTGAVVRMTIAQLLEVDRDGEILGWLSAIADRIK
jgi:predicted ATP-dependent endonuclease of OLD family